MKYTPKLPNADVNVTHQPIKELLHLVGGVIIVLVVIYFLLGITGWCVARYSSEEFEAVIGEMLLPLVLKDRDLEAEPEIQAVMDKLLRGVDKNGTEVAVRVTKGRQLGAFALPGRTVVVTRGLIKTLRSENAMAMVLGHELGHIQKRDSMKALGRSLGLISFSVFLIGEDSSAAQFFRNGITLGALKYSRDQERKADEFALDLLNRVYGHVGGATDFFEIALDQHGDALSGINSTHPLLSKRIKYLRKFIKQKHFKVQ